MTKLNRRLSMQAIAGGLVAGTFNVWAAEPKIGMGPPKVEELDLWEKIENPKIKRLEVHSSFSHSFKRGDLTPIKIVDHQYIIADYKGNEIYMEQLNETELKQYKQQMVQKYLPKLINVYNQDTPLVAYTQDKWVEFKHLICRRYGVCYHGLLVIKHHG